MGFPSFFWHDQWCDSAPLRKLFLAFFLLAVGKDVSIMYCGDQKVNLFCLGWITL